jgi:hypothetical protein
MLLSEIFWWIHAGILVFMNYLYFSKHLHILLAFPNTYFANLNVQGQFDNLESVTKRLMMDPNADPLQLHQLMRMQFQVNLVQVMFRI